MKNLQIHYDCDTGQDDAIALLFALGAGVDIASISTVGGNVDVRKCTANTLKILEFSGRESIPVYEGAAKPLNRQPQPLPEVFGECGMAGANLPDVKTSAQAMSAHRFLSEKKLPDTVVATGPLTNLAQAISINSDFAKNVNKLFIMGGCVYPEHIWKRLGNIQVNGSDGWAEYNFAVDPEAAQVVFSSGIQNLYVVPLNVTRKVLYNGRIDQALRDSGKKSQILAANILSTVGAEDHEDYASEKESAQDPVRAMHDVLIMAYLVHPEIFQTEQLPIRIETGAPPNAAGQSIIDDKAPDHSDVTVIRGIDDEKFIEYLITYLGKI